MKDPNRRRPARASAAPAAVFGLDAGLWKGKPSAPRPGRRLWLALSAAFLLSVLALSAYRFLGASSRPVLVTTWQQHPSALRAVSSDYHTQQPQPTASGSSVHVVSFPDHLLVYQNYPSYPPETTPSCHYPPSTLAVPPFSVDLSPSLLLLRCPLPPRPTPLRWDALTYAALLDRRDNSTLAFAKGLNLRPERLSDASRYECVFGFRALFDRPRLLLPSPALSVAQEVVRCRTPLAVLLRAATPGRRPAVLVSVRVRARGGPTLPSLASPVTVDPPPPPPARPHRMCVCTMVRNQARFLREWVTYHARVGVERWFVYDNNSNDSLPEISRRLDAEGFNVSRHPWPWIKTQEAGFAHCALRARAACEWVGFIDVDEFLHLPTPTTLREVLANHSTNFPWVGELRTTCYSFGPSGRRAAPPEGVTVGYTCRMATPERHKSIVRPEALSPSLINVVHHFHLRDRFEYVNMDRSLVVINHYKYQVWDVFKEKFYRRVATYVADWREEENVGSKDRAPGLGTKAVEPPDWPNWFCEVRDTGLRNWVIAEFADPTTGLLPWSDLSAGLGTRLGS